MCRRRGRAAVAQRADCMSFLLTVCNYGPYCMPAVCLCMPAVCLCIPLYVDVCRCMHCCMVWTISAVFLLYVLYASPLIVIIARNGVLYGS